ncbi:MAG TPA: hypothetical protein VNR36_03510 [Pseudolysinimonas sp.]|nr:hypothetical protein [Pseudolysinimonas sp.]
MKGSAATEEALGAFAAAQRPLDRLAALQGLLRALEADPAALEAVREALEAGETWADIARSAGFGVAAAKWRWQGTDAEIAARHEAGRKRSARPSSKPADLPGLSVTQAAERLGISVQGVYQRITRGQLRAETVTIADGRSYKRVFPD